MATLPELVSQSEALRRMNLPSTSRWKEFLNNHVQGRSAGGSILYPLAEVERVASKMADFAAEVLPSSDYAEPSRSSKVIDRRGPQLHTR